MTTVQSMPEFRYKIPRSLKETLRLLEKEKAGAKVLAGGTDLVLQMKQGLVIPSLVIDVKKVRELNRLDWDQKDGLRIGAAVSISKLLTYEILHSEFSILAQAIRVIGSRQIKNRASVGGNICNGAPSADAAPALLCLGASVVLASGDRARTLSIAEFFKGPGETAVGNDEVLVEIRVPNPPAFSSGCYLRHTTREEMDIAIVGVGSFLILSPEKKVQEARIALGAVAPTPVRARQAESALVGQTVTESIIEAAAEMAATEAKPISDVRGSADYRREIVKVLTRRTLKNSCKEVGITI